MKRILFLAALAIFSIQSISAQYGRGNGNGYGRQSSISNQQPSTPPEPKEVKPTDVIDERLPEYVQVFKLDAFEAEVLRSTLETFYTDVFAIQKSKTMDQESMRKSFERSQEQLKSDLGAFLDKEEIDKFMAMDFSTSAKRKRKKGKKN